MRLFSEPLWMLWRTNVCVMLGRNQAAQTEINLTAANRLGVEITRRSSGGGAIFTDPGTLLYTYICPYDGASDVKERESVSVVQPIIRALKKLGASAVAQGRNDLVADSGKVSGLAQYVQKDRLCTHGSLLYDADLDLMETVLCPGEAKLATKALPSVRARVTNLRPLLPELGGADAFQSALCGALNCEMDFRSYAFSASDLHEIYAIQQEKYANGNWVFGQSPPHTLHGKKRFAGGQVEVFLDVRYGIVSSCAIQGDFLGVLPVDAVELALTGNTCLPDKLAFVLDGMDLRPYLGGVTSAELLNCIFE
ncbi:lipoate--protein ligase [Clostridia bacterium]|nr:lipoate--protein ligase [Clostridia bacterium]